MKLIAILGFLVLAGCTDKSPPTAQQLAALTEQGGCGDVTFYAGTADGKVALVVRSYATHLMSMLPTAASSIKINLTLPDNGWLVQVEKGERLLVGMCTDVGPPSPPDIQHTYLSRGGTLDLDAAADANGTWKAQIHIEGLQVADDAGVALSLPPIDFVDLHLGWYPG